MNKYVREVELEVGMTSRAKYESVMICIFIIVEVIIE